MAILITGGAGFTGSELALTFLDRGEKVVIFDVFKNETLEQKESGDIIQLKGDIRNWPEVLNVVKDHEIQAIFHLAAMLTVPSEANPWACVQVNALGTFHVLEAARLFGVSKVIFPSSIGAYGVTWDTVVTEDTIQRPTNIYGVTKVFGELLGLYYFKKFGIDFRGVRLPQVVGPRVISDGIGQYNPKLIEAAVLGVPFEAWVPEDTVMPMLYIKDAVRSLVMLHDAPEHAVQTRVYGVGQITPPPTARQLVDEVKKYYPEAQITFRPDQNAMFILKNIPTQIKGDRAEAEWGWKPAYTLQEMVKDFIGEFKRMMHRN